MNINKNKYNYVIVGTGLGGLILADTLRRRYPDKKILMIEKGPADHGRSGNLKQKEIGIPFAHINQFGGTSNVWGKGLTVLHEVRDRYNRKIKLSYMRSVINVLRSIGIFKYRDIIALSQGSAGIDIKKIYMLSDTYSLKKNVKLDDIEILTESELSHFRMDANENFLTIETRNKNSKLVKAEKVVFCCGAMDTPLVLEKLKLIKTDRQNIFDHPSAYIGTLENNNENIDQSYMITNLLKNGDEIKHCFTITIENNIKVGIYFKPITNSVKYQRKIDQLGMLYHARKSLGLAKFILAAVKNPIILMYAIKHKYLNTKIIRKVAIYVISEMVHESEIKNSKTELISNINTDSKIRVRYDRIMRQVEAKLEVIGIKLHHEANIDWHSAAHFHGTIKRKSTEIDQNELIRNFELANCPNVYVCDASLIPKEGHSNLGLTIMAMANYLGRNI